MNRLRVAVALTVAALAAVSGAAYALGLGEIDLQSRLNQPLRAEIPLLALQPGERESLKVRMADAAAFKRVGLQRPALLSAINIQVLEGPSPGTGRILLTSREIVKEPILTFLLELDWPEGTVVREYTLLFDPPNLDTVVQREQVDAPAEEAVVVERRPPPVVSRAPTGTDRPRSSVADDLAVLGRPAESVFDAPAGEFSGLTRPPLRDEVPTQRQPELRSADGVFADLGPGEAAYAGERYGPVRRQQTLWSIAESVRPDPSITMDQMQLAIYRANPQAFEGSINRMRAGVILTIPSASEIRSINPYLAKREVARQRRGAAAAPVASRSEAPPEPAAAAPEPEPETTDQGEPEITTPPEEATTDETAAETEPSQGSSQGAPELAEALQEDGAAPLTDTEALELSDGDTQAAAADEQPAEEADAASDEQTKGLALLADEAGHDAAGTEGPEPADAEQADQAPPAETEASVETVWADEPGPADDSTADADSISGVVDEAIPDSINTGPFSFEQIALAAAVFLALLGLIWLYQRRKWSRYEAEEPEQAEAPQADEQAPAYTPPTGLEPAYATVGAAAPAQTADRSEPEPDLAGFDSALDTSSSDDEASSPDTPRLAASGEHVSAAGGATDLGDLLEPSDAAAGPPLSEPAGADPNELIQDAEHHIQNGLYEEAITVLQLGLERYPQRRDLRLKLLEAHHAAGNRDQFMAQVRYLYDKPPAEANDEWTQISTMGRNLDPDNAMFRAQAAATRGAQATDDVSLNLSDLEDSLGPSGVEDSTSKQETAESLGPVTLAAVGIDDESEASADAEALEFELADFSLEDEPAASQPEQSEKGGGALDIDLSEFELDDEFPVETETASADSDLDLESSDLEFKLDSEDAASDQETTDFDDDSIAPASDAEDEINTKLDLARAYIDMGEPDMAKSLLDEVQSQGSEEQRNEAQELLSSA